MYIYVSIYIYMYIYTHMWACACILSYGRREDHRLAHGGARPEALGDSVILLSYSSSSLLAQLKAARARPRDRCRTSFQRHVSCHVQMRNLNSCWQCLLVAR